MKSLSTVQALSKTAKIISTILFVCAIVGLCLSAAAFVSLLFGFEAFKIGDTTIEGLIPEAASMSDGNLYALLSQSMVACIIVIVLTAFAKHYLKRELADGTPFTFGGAKELLRLRDVSGMIMGAKPRRFWKRICPAFRRKASMRPPGRRSALR